MIGYVIGNLIYEISIYIYDFEKVMCFYYIIVLISIMSMIYMYSIFENYYYDIVIIKT